MLERCVTFFGEIAPPYTNTLRACLCGYIQDGARKITILFASPGGSVDDGLALYTFLTALPVELTMHAVGIVGSMAVPVFLAGQKRIASANARFHFHEFSWTYPNGGNVTQSTMNDNSVRLNEVLEWSKELVATKTLLAKKDIKRLRLFDHPFYMKPADALSYGIISSIEEPYMKQEHRPQAII